MANEREEALEGKSVPPSLGLEGNLWGEVKKTP